jgi:hypothetical protein
MRRMSRLAPIATKDVIGSLPMPKQRPKPDDKPGEPPPPMTADKIAQAALSLALLQAKDDNADAYEMLALLALECLAFLAGRDPESFHLVLGGLDLYARMRHVECLRSAQAGLPPPPLNAMFEPPVRVH